MLGFVRQLGQRVCGVLSGFDRLLFRGILRCVIDPRGLNGYLYGAKVALTNYGQHVPEVSPRLKVASLAHAREVGCEIRYLDNSQERKKDLALEIAQRDGIRPGGGLICVLSCVEPCATFDVQRDPVAKKIALVRRFRKCLHLYHYFDHERFGLMHVRLQTWFPFTVQVCMNGREWLIRDLTKAGIAHVRRDNCVCEVDDMEAAQKFLNEQLTAAWPELLKGLLRQVHPVHESIFANCPEHARDYYWSVADSEWASDVLFRDPAEVLPLAERLAAYSLRVHGPGDTRLFNEGRLMEGLRLKHRVNANSVKMYNRPGVLRFETTICNPTEFKVWRTLENAPADAPCEWLPMRKGIAGLRNADVRVALFGADPIDDAKELHRRSSAASRKLALLRAHGLLQKVPQSHHDRVTPKGQQSLTTLFAAANASTTELNKLAA